MSAEVTAESVDIDAAEGTADAIFARPASGGPHPAVLLYMDAYGIRPALEAHAARLAAAGYCVLVPNLFYRNGRSPVLEDLEQLMQSEDRSALFAQLRPKIEALTPEAQTPTPRPGWGSCATGPRRATARSARSATAWAGASACA